MHVSFFPFETIWPKTGPFRGVFWMIRFSPFCTKTHFPENQKSLSYVTWLKYMWQEWVTSHTTDDNPKSWHESMSHVTYDRRQSMSHVTYESMSHVTYDRRQSKELTWTTYTWVLSHIHESRHIRQSKELTWITYTWVLPLTWESRLQIFGSPDYPVFLRLWSHMNESRHGR